MPSIERRLSGLVRAGGRLRVATSALLAGFGLVILGAAIGSSDQFVPFFLFGALPFAVGLAALWGYARESESTPAGAESTATGDELTDEFADDDLEGDPISVLKLRYARGDIDDDAFERKLDRLLEAEDARVPAGTRDRREIEEVVESDS